MNKFNLMARVYYGDNIIECIENVCSVESDQDKYFGQHAKIFFKKGNHNYHYCVGSNKGTKIILEFKGE